MNSPSGSPFRLPSTVLSDLRSLGGAGAQVVELPAGSGVREGAAYSSGGVVWIGVHRSGPVPVDGLDHFDILLSHDPEAPRPFVGTRDIDGVLARLLMVIEAQPVAAAVAAQVLRNTLQVDFESALVAESLAYSMLLTCEDFRTWRRANPARARADDGAPRVLHADGEIRLCRGGARNAVDARMRDELCEALILAMHHAGAIRLSGEGPSFCAGGDLDEFGRADDAGQAHLIRILRSPARLVQAVRERVTVHLHGACIGAGIEITAAAGNVTARADAVFKLPEVAMGLIPGAGGTATLPRRIGRRRTCFLAISGMEIDLPTALAWGLVDAVAP